MYRDLNVVEPALLSCLEPLESQQVLKLLRMLGVHELEPQQLLDEHIYPTLQSSMWKVPAESDGGIRHLLNERPWVFNWSRRSVFFSRSLSLWW